MLALVLSMGPPGTIPAPSQVSRPALRNRARAQVATPSGGPQDEILAPGPSHISRARRDVTSPCAPRAHARLGAERGPTGHDPGALSDQRAVRSACGQSAVTNVLHALRAVNVRVLPEANVRSINMRVLPEANVRSINMRVLHEANVCERRMRIPSGANVLAAAGGNVRCHAD
jgi:hypothetical protein